MPVDVPNAPGSAGAPLPIGLLGLGKHGARYLDHVRRDLPELFRVVAVSRRNESAGRATAAEIGARFHGSIDDLIHDPAVRAVVSVLPPTENPCVVDACARAGVPLLIEKPFAHTLAAAVRQHDVLERAGVPCVIAQTLRWNGVVSAVRAQLGDIGDVHQVTIGQTFEPSPLDWIDRPEISGGGMILHTGVHMFDLVRWLTGAEAEQVTCFTGRIATTRTEDEFVANLRLHAPSGREILVAVAGSRATRSRSGPLRLIGDRAQIVADHVRGELARVADRHTETLPRPAEVATVAAVLRAFHAVVTRGAPSPVTPADGVRSIAIVDACYRSAAAGGAPTSVGEPQFGEPGAERMIRGGEAGDGRGGGGER